MNASSYILQSDRLLLRPFIDTDIDAVFQGLSHPEIIKYYGVSYQTKEATKAQMTFFSDLEKNGTGRWWAICDVNNEIFFGAAGLNNVSKENKKGEIGFWLLQDAWGKGIMQEAIPLVLDFGFQQLNLHRIEAIVETENEACKKLMTKFNFSHEGTMKECEIKEGKFISLDMYATFYPNT